jgi:hypothetical protein
VTQTFSENVVFQTATVEPGSALQAAAVTETPVVRIERLRTNQRKKNAKSTVIIITAVVRSVVVLNALLFLSLEGQDNGSKTGHNHR